MEETTFNFGGFVPVSTVDWPGRCVCTLFLRGCPLSCWYCQNKEIRTGRCEIPISEIKEKISKSMPLITAAVFSGGEPCYQTDALLEIVDYCNSVGLDTGIHTSGFYPDSIKELVKVGLKKVSLDIKASKQNYVATTQNRLSCERAYKSLDVCRGLYATGKLKELDVVTTVFASNSHDVVEISNSVGNLPYVLQQGLVDRRPELDVKEIISIARSLNRKVRIRTGPDGELIL